MNNVDMVRIITRGSKLKFQLTIGVFSIAFVMSVIDYRIPEYADNEIRTAK